MADKKNKPKPKAEMLGSGLAARAAKALQARTKRMEAILGGSGQSADKAQHNDKRKNK